MSSSDEVIVAVASPAGGAARAIIRVSGPHSLACVARAVGRTAPRLADLTSPQVVCGSLSLLRYASAEVIACPCDLYVWPTSRSFTRQPMVEIHMPGSPPLVDAAVRQLCDGGARLAEPGEFTLRAFLAGRIDLTQAEAVLGVIDASSQSQLHVALQQLAGGFSGPLNQVRDEILGLLAELEAGLDFAEEDIEFISLAEVQHRLRECVATVNQLLHQLAARKVPLDVPSVVIFGATNVGKSSLLNTLACDTRTIVSSKPGTTRDYVNVRARLGNLVCDIIDTAGINADLVDSGSGIDNLSQQMTLRQLDEACLILFCLDGSRPLNVWEQETLQALSTVPRMLVVTKADLPRRLPSLPDEICTSSSLGTGIDELRSAMVRGLSQESCEGNVVAETSLRCQQSLTDARDSLERALKLAGSSGEHELIAHELRLGLNELGRVVGAVYTDDILDQIFSRFCIGK